MESNVTSAGSIEQAQAKPSTAIEMKGFEVGNKALDKLTILGLGGTLFEHEAATTVEEQQKALAGLEGVKTKNLFLKVRYTKYFVWPQHTVQNTVTKTC